MPRLTPEQRAEIDKWLEQHDYSRIVKTRLYKTEQSTAVIEIIHADGYVKEIYCKSPRDAAMRLANLTSVS